MPSSAAAVEFAGPRQVRVAAVALPEPGPDEVVVTTHFSGISGGRELLAYRGEIDPGVPLDDRIESLDGTFTTRSDTAMPVSGRPTASRCSRSTHIRTSSSPGVTGATGCAEWPPRWPTARRTWIRNPSCSSTRASRPNVTSSQRTPSTRPGRAPTRAGSVHLHRTVRRGRRLSGRRGKPACSSPLLTLGCPEQLSGGYLYHCRLAELAGDHDAEVEFVPVCGPTPSPRPTATSCWSTTSRPGSSPRGPSGPPTVVGPLPRFSTSRRAASTTALRGDGSRPCSTGTCTAAAGC